MYYVPREFIYRSEGPARWAVVAEELYPMIVTDTEVAAQDGNWRVYLQLEGTTEKRSLTPVSGGSLWRVEYEMRRLIHQLQEQMREDLEAMSNSRIGTAEEFNTIDLDVLAKRCGEDHVDALLMCLDAMAKERAMGHS